MAQPTLLSIAKADLITAGKNVDNANKLIKHQAAYFTQQSIEKTLKYLIELSTGNAPWGHNIKVLVNQALKLNIYVPSDIIKNADKYSTWETSARYYPTTIIRRDTVKKAIWVVSEWHKYLAKINIK